MRVRFLTAVSALVWPAIAAPAPPQPLQPVDKWQLDFGDTVCTAARPYGDSANPIVFAIIPSLNQAYFKVMVSEPRAGPRFARESRGSVDFGRGPIGAELMYYGKAGVKQSVTQFVLPAADLARAGTATAVTVRTNHGSYGFTLSEFPKLLSGLHKCSVDLARYWNMVGASAAVTAAVPLADVRTLLTPNDYPREALALRPRSSSQYQLLIDENGAVAGCDVVAPSGAQTLDSTACQVIAGKARFRPARDAGGKAVKSAWTTPSLSWTSGVESAFDSGCTKMSSDGRTLVNMCADSRNNGRFQPATPPPPPPPPPPPGK